MNGGIYQITCITTGVVYIGQTVNFRERWLNHQAKLERGVHGNSHLQRAWHKYGADAFVFAVVEEIARLTPEALSLAETRWMENYQAAGYDLFNVCPSTNSHLGVKRSAETCDNLRRAMLGKTHTPETRARLAELGRGKHLSEETRRKLSCARMGNQNARGKRYTEEERQAISARLQGHAITIETRQRISAALTGRHWAGQTRQKMEKCYRFVSPAGELVECVGLRAFCREQGLNASHMASVAQGKRPAHKGWRQAPLP